MFCANSLILCCYVGNSMHLSVAILLAHIAMMM
jgi:hypothetical protein